MTSDEKKFFALTCLEIHADWADEPNAVDKVCARIIYRLDKVLKAENEKLQEENQRLRTALEHIANSDCRYPDGDAWPIENYTRTALGGKAGAK